MRHYLLKSKYRFAIFGLIVSLIALWYGWLRTDQIISSSLNIYVTGITLLNIGLGFFVYDRQPFITTLLFSFSFVVILLAAYTILSLSWGLR